MDDEIDEALFDMDDSYSPDLADEWRTWHMDDPQLESDATAEERYGIGEQGWRKGRAAWRRRKRWFIVE